MFITIAGGRISCLKCSAKSKRTGNGCMAPAMRGKAVCKTHGGRSTGPRTAEGIERIRQAQLKHGERTKEAVAESRSMSAKMLYLRDIGDHVGMFEGTHTRGRKPTGYVKLNMSDPVQLKIALMLTIGIGGSLPDYTPATPPSMRVRTRRFEELRFM